MSAKVIEIVISAQGETTVQTKGFAGASCQDASRFIERAMGDKTAERMTPEFYQTSPVQEQQQAGSG